MEIWGVPFHYLPVLVYKEFFEIPGDVCLLDWCPVNSAGWSYGGCGTRTQTLRENSHPIEKKCSKILVKNTDFFENSFIPFQIAAPTWFTFLWSWKLSWHTVILVVWLHISPVLLSLQNAFTYLHVCEEGVLDVTVDIVFRCENKVVSRNVSVSGAYFTNPIQELAVPSRFLKGNCTDERQIFCTPQTKIIILKMCTWREFSR